MKERERKVSGVREDGRGEEGMRKRYTCGVP